MFHVDCTFEDCRIIATDAGHEDGLDVRIVDEPSGLIGECRLTHDELALGLMLACSRSGDGPETSGSDGPAGILHGSGTYASLDGKLRKLGRSELRFIP